MRPTPPLRNPAPFVTPCSQSSAASVDFLKKVFKNTGRNTTITACLLTAILTVIIEIRQVPQQEVGALTVGTAGTHQAPTIGNVHYLHEVAAVKVSKSPPRGKR